MHSNVSRAAACALTLAAASQASIIATGQVTIEDRTLINGDIQAGLGGRLGTGNGSKVNGNITSCGDFILRDGAAFQNLFYQGLLTKGQRLTFSSINPITNCQRVAAPVVTVTSGTSAVNVGIAQTVEIQPGKYGAVYVGSQKATLRFKAGTYEIYSLRTEPEAHLEFEKGVILKVATDVNLGDRSDLRGPDAANTIFEVKRNFTSGTDMTIPMKIVSATGTVQMKDRTNFNDIYSYHVMIGNDCNGLAGPPVVKKVLFFDDFGDADPKRSAPYIGLAGNWYRDANGVPQIGVPNDEKLRQNWTVSTGSIDVVRLDPLVDYKWIAPLNLQPQGWFVDLVGSDGYNNTSTTLETKTEFPAGKYQVSFKLAGINRVLKDNHNGNQTNFAKAEVKFGDFEPTRGYILAYEESFKPLSFTATLKTPSRLVITATNAGDMGGLLLDDVEVRQLD